MTLFIETLQQVIATFDDGTSTYSTDYSKYSNIFTIKIHRQAHRGTPCVKYDGESFSYQIMDCPEYDDPMCESIEHLYDSMYFIEED